MTGQESEVHLYFVCHAQPVDKPLYRMEWIEFPRQTILKAAKGRTIAGQSMGVLNAYIPDLGRGPYLVIRKPASECPPIGRVRAGNALSRHHVTISRVKSQAAQLLAWSEPYAALVKRHGVDSGWSYLLETALAEHEVDWNCQKHSAHLKP